MKLLTPIVAAMMLFAFIGIQSAEGRDKNSVMKASSLIGTKVVGSDGKKLGDIKDLVIDPEDGSVVYAVLDFGGFLGIGDKYFAVPWEALTMPDRKTVVLDVSKRDLKKAPGFDKTQWPDLISRENAIVIYEFYGVPMPED